MRPRPPVAPALALLVLACLAPLALAQRAPEWRVGAGYLISRPNDTHLWGLNVRREQQLTRALVYRGVASVDFLGLDLFNPLLATVGADVGLRARLAPLTGLIALGPTLGYVVASRRIDTYCQSGSCYTVQRGYEPGLVLAATASGALGLQISSELRIFYEARVHVPSGIGRSGYAGDPHAAFVELAFGVTLLR